MKRWTFRLALVVTGLALAGRAQAAALYTAPASSAFAGEEIICDAVNVGKAPVLMKIEVRNYVGSVVDSTPEFPLMAGEMVSEVSTGIDGAYCKFIVTGSTKGIRAHAIYSADPGSRTITVPAK